MKVVDLRSDTLTLPTEEMMECMQKAKMGDDGRTNGLKGEDPTAAALEMLAAKRFGKEDALFVPSGTMGNMVSLLAWAKRGDAVVVAQNAHVIRSEKGIFNQDFCGLVPEIVTYAKGSYDLNELEATLKSKKIAAVCIENTHNAEGGTVMSVQQTQAITRLGKRYGVPVHLDGARIFNASQALGVDVKQLTEGVDSIMACVSKGLCAPIGSVVVGSAEFIKKAREKRKIVGGQMRQVGVIAAAGIVAIEKMTERLKEDHLRASRLAAGLAKIPGLTVAIEDVKTNIVKVDFDFRNLGVDQFLRELSEEYKVKAGPITEKSFRLVTYNGITDEDITAAIQRVTDYCRKRAE